MNAAKRPSRLRFRVAACAGLLLLALSSAMTPARAEQAGGLSPQAYQRLEKIHGLIDSGNTGAALSALNELLAAVGQRRYERAVVLQNLGHVHAGRGQYPEAIRTFSESLSLEALPETAEQQLRYNLAQLHLAGGEAGQAVKLLQTWFAQAEDPPAGAWLLLGHAQAGLGAYREAVPAMRKAIELADTPHADWYENLLAMHYELDEYRDCATLLQRMIRLFPDNDAYWHQLSGIYLGMNRADRALAVMELLWRRGRLTSEAGLVQLARLYLQQDIPYQAARLLEQSMQTNRVSRSGEHQALLATAWALARERAAAIRSYRRAAQAGAGAEIDFRLAQLYLEDERGTEAARTLETALAKPGLDTPGTAWLLLGIARYESGAAAPAREAFSKAAGFDGSRKAARQWLEHLDAPS
jgi:predicted Zn-dependent protease